MTLEDRIEAYLQQRKENYLYRQLTVNQNLIDFSSNDYLGLARSAYVKQQVEQDYKNYQAHKSGATGARLLNGNSALYEELEGFLATTHHAEAALLYNSGFDANVGLIATVARKGDMILYDEMVHASIHQGIRLSEAASMAFRHNDMTDLQDKLNRVVQGNAVFIITESLFSMDGDKAPLVVLAEMAHQSGAYLIVDEAHATGLFGIHGSGLCNVAGVEEQCFARVYTFGKAIGSHGAVVAGSAQLKEYLINFSRNFIYSTALDTHTLLSVKHSYFYIQNNINQIIRLNNLNFYFNELLNSRNDHIKWCGAGPIFGVIIGGNQKCKAVAQYLQQHGFDVRAILSPTVPEGTERLRIILHSFNTQDQVQQLFNLIVDYQ